LYGLVVGGATRENVHLTFRPISTRSIIRQQHHFINAFAIDVHYDGGLRRRR
jgi:hypothetical protein